ncbi:MAG: PstS family phosphate ABC transporter substrate-binding protein [Chloroflexota bacterium]|jgi:phosphate transport system substrate-binding protein|nr:PstS family phosphate ABC transporter substrate-binding protein [Chloroflexota bacterium]
MLLPGSVRRVVRWGLVSLFVVVGTACGSAADVQTIFIDGSSTVGPITQAVAEEFQGSFRGARVPVGVSGSGGGFHKFCTGETDITNASRPIRKIEIELCAENGIGFVELPIAFDGLAVVTNPDNDFVACLTVEELQRIWEPAAERAVTSWAQVRPGFPDEELLLYGPGVDSGTYDYFTTAIVGEEGASRGDFTPSEDDNVLVQGIAGDRNAIGFFGLAYFTANSEALKLLGVNSGDGCVTPSPETVNSGVYQPLSRPLFIYVSLLSTEREDIQTFIRFYLENAGLLVSDVGYVALTDELYVLAIERFENRVTGSVYAGEGAMIGVALEDLLRE